ncbi:unnamed protein product [Cuscuta epithymum]|uniref:Uncharacterized protein n=1 Tax=Cuscuta epithymum TaxID=186058 RepID=A0AAV0GFI8_9ASTE|nr:unnamed protein product [Cuscuta epithymum]
MDFCDPDLYNKFLQYLQTHNSKTASANVAMSVHAEDPPSSTTDHNQFLGPSYQQNHWLC